MGEIIGKFKVLLKIRRELEFKKLWNGEIRTILNGCYNDAEMDLNKSIKGN